MYLRLWLPACVLVLLAACARPRPAEPPLRPAPVVPPKAEAIDAAIERGVAFLLKRQNPNGSWGSILNSTGMDVYAPVPGAHQAFRGAVTALCVSALIEVKDPRPEAAKALDRAETWLMANLPKVRRAEPAAIYNVWAHAYGIDAFVHMLRQTQDPARPSTGSGRPELAEGRREKIVALIEGQIDLLERYETVDGGWGYYDFRAHTNKPSGQPNSFTTATVLVALAEARDAGIPVPPKLVERALFQMHKQQNPDFTYLYSEGFTWRPVAPINRPGGSLGRSQACNLALRLWGDRKITDGVLDTWLGRLFARNGWLDIARKRPIPHESWFQVAAYFFYYGHYYAALCIDQLPPAERRYFQEHLAYILLRLQEQDGSWWDFPLYDYHQPYGTAFALMSLVRCGRRAP